MDLKYLITKRFKNWIIYILVKGFFNLLRILPRSFCFFLLTRISLLCFYVIPDARKKTIRNLTRVFGSEKNAAEIWKMAKSVFRDLGRNAVDMFRLKQVVGKDPDRYVTCHGWENLDNALAKGKGVVVITGHLGCWELMAGYVSSKGYAVSVVGTPLYDPRLDKMLVDNRTSVGLKNIIRSTGAREILRTLRNGEIVGILIDQDTRVDGVFVDFLGKPAFTPVGPVVLALKTGAAIVPMAIHIDERNRHIIEMEPEIDLQTTDDKENDRLLITLKCSKAIEKLLLKNVTQWVWMHERWKTQPKESVE
ncbi:lysophospholipid acyltransferase family protein [candidate division KSB1 bacterium]|nr:lysophospholipid acyltransferase family protein [candidate division KSB1 bacterium]